jgi:hypothetical protein
MHNRHKIFLGETLSRENPNMNSSLYYSDELHMSKYNSPQWDDNIPREIKEEL